MAQLHNTATTSGSYDGVDIDNSTELFVELSALNITKTADKKIWVKDELGYTITVKNIDVRDDPTDPDYPGLPVTNVIITDTIDPAIASLIVSTLTLEVNGTAVDPVDYDYDSSGLLTVRVGTLATNEEAVITFRVEEAT